MSRPRPMPPVELSDGEGFGRFEPSMELAAWVRGTFIDDGATVENPDHDHLKQANIGFLWTNELNEKRGRMILGTCQMLPPTGDKWTVGARVAQLDSWFMEMPDFLITIYAPAAAGMDDASFMALIEHELSHCGQRKDNFGSPMFSKETGEPIWCTNPHSVEEFTGVVARYGAWSPDLKAMALALGSEPQIAPATISIACGSCR